MKLPYFLLFGLLLVTSGQAADHSVASALRTFASNPQPAPRTVLSAPGPSVRSADPARIALAETGPESQPEPVRFEAIDVFVDSGAQPLAAYQFELKAPSGNVLLVGLEGGEHPAFKSAPYYDPTALLQNKVIVAAFSTGPDLPHGRTRVARLMVQVTGPIEPAYDAALVVAGSTDGKPIAAAKIAVATERAGFPVPAMFNTSNPSQTPNASEGVVR